MTRSRPADDDQDPSESDFKHRVHVALSAMWGVGLFVGMAVSLTIIFGMSVDVAKAVDTVVSLILTAVLVAATFVVATRARARWDKERMQAREQT
ncbi:hypothetical protein M1247_15405 [Mycobacterium sp. 21AC1]|uniref:hypothetical protein n=1 Tax=[Mycobacterium] appelbergii TaxID=2939269 RepID=UPI0029394B76|nr:hypothetical protein [Mycobacterium sp. 21AC1]MDV3126308.1 hypothetical protein [Mycobacterium sp. 21AC1]